MVSITLSVPEETRKIMKKFPEINWSGLVRACIVEKTKKLALREKLLEQLKKEKGFMDWSVDIVRKGRHKK